MPFDLIETGRTQELINDLRSDKNWEMSELLNVLALSFAKKFNHKYETLEIKDEDGIVFIKSYFFKKEMIEDLVEYLKNTGCFPKSDIRMVKALLYGYLEIE